MSSDVYAHLAEYGSLFTAAEPRPLPKLPDDVIEGARNVVELGGGTGVHTVSIAEQLESAHVWTVESSAAMRAVLHSTLGRHPHLTDRITIEPGDLFTAPPPAGWDLAIGYHFTCQLRSPQRRELWQLVAQRLTRDGAAIFDRHYGPTSDVPVERRLSQTTTLGHNEYQRWFASERIADGHVRAHVEYRLVRDGRVLAEASTMTDMDVVSEVDIFAEVALAELHATVTDDWLILRRR